MPNLRVRGFPFPQKFTLTIRTCHFSSTTRNAGRTGRHKRVGEAMCRSGKNCLIGNRRSERLSLAREKVSRTTMKSGYTCAWWMPRLEQAMKDVGGCDKPRGVAKQTLIRGFPNGTTQPCAARKFQSSNSKFQISSNDQISNSSLF